MHFLVWLLLFTIIAGILTCFVGFYVDYQKTTRRIRELRFLLQHPRPNPNPYSYLYRHNIPIQVITDRNHNIAWFRELKYSRNPFRKTSLKQMHQEFYGNGSILLELLIIILIYFVSPMVSIFSFFGIINYFCDRPINCCQKIAYYRSGLRIRYVTSTRVGYSDTNMNNVVHHIWIRKLLY